MNKTIQNTLIASFMAIAIVMTAMPAGRAEAQTVAQSQIAALLAQIAQLQAQVIALTGAPATAGSCPTFTSDMTIGRTGADVTALQNFLMGKGFSIPAGATGFFGGQTQSALVNFQRAHSITPAVGYFGPLTRAKVHALCTPVTPTTPTTPTTPATPTTPTTPTTPVATLRGEATIERFQVKNGDESNLEESQKNMPVMEIQFRVEDGDVQINRFDLAFTPDVTNDENDPWKTFGEVSIWNGSTQIAKIDASNKQNWKEDNPVNGTSLLRMSGLAYVIKEGKEVNLVVKVSTQKSIDGTSNGEVWAIAVPDNGIRGIDAEKALVYAGDSSDSVTIDIDKAGTADEVIIKRSSDDPDATVLAVKDNGRSGFIEVFAFDIDTDDSNGDIEMRKLPIQLTVSTSTVDTFMRDIRLVVDGKTHTRKTVTDGLTNTVLFDFRSGEFVIDAGDRVTVVVEVDFKSLAEVHEGTTISGSVQTANIDARGNNRLTGSQLSGAATSETHTLNTKGSSATVVSKTAEVTSVSGANNDYATFSITTNVTAFGQDVYISSNVAESISYQLKDTSGAVIASTSVPTLSSNAKEIGSYFYIPEGETKTITLEVTYLPGSPMATARLQLLSMGFSGSAIAPTQTWNATPASTYTTAIKTIVN